MKKWIHSSTEGHGKRSPKTRYIYEVCDAMGWEQPWFKDRTDSGYRLKWGDNSYVGHIFDQLVNHSMVSKLGLDPKSYESEYGNIGWLSVRKALNDAGYAWNSEELDGRFNELEAEAVRENKKKAWDLAQEDIKEIEDKSGIKCHLNRAGFLIVPYGPDEW